MIYNYLLQGGSYDSDRDRYDGLRFSPMYRIVTDGIAEGLTLRIVITTAPELMYISLGTVDTTMTLHDAVTTSASWGGGVVSSKSCSVRPLITAV